MELSQSGDTMPVSSEATSTSTTEVPRVVGDPLPAPIFFGAGGLLFISIVAFGIGLRRHSKYQR